MGLNASRPGTREDCASADRQPFVGLAASLGVQPDRVVFNEGPSGNLLGIAKHPLVGMRVPETMRSDLHCGAIKPLLDARRVRHVPAPFVALVFVRIEKRVRRLALADEGGAGRVDANAMGLRRFDIAAQALTPGTDKSVRAFQICSSAMMGCSK